MLRQISLVLGIGALIATSASFAQASPVKPQNANQEKQTRAERALSNLESRSIAKDGEVFFPDSANRTTPNYPDGNVDNRTRSEADFEVLGQEFQVRTGETSNPNDIFDPTYSFSNGDTSDKVRVLVEVDEWNNN